MSLRTTVLGQQAVITELHSTDRRRQAQFIEALKLLKGLQTQMTECATLRTSREQRKQDDNTNNHNITKQDSEHWRAYTARSGVNANNANNQRGIGSGQKPAYYGCGVQGYFKRECIKLKNNNNCGNQVRGGNALANLYAVGHAGTNPDSNIMMGTFLLNNRYASILFDTGADRSFVSTAFSS
ncbi:putative reverse transcriptase domain-containing protein [Tanacetum coccineum]